MHPVSRRQDAHRGLARPITPVLTGRGRVKVSGPLGRTPVVQEVFYAVEIKG
jgi:hypothetical protein